jgi:hypothetical protein
MSECRSASGAALHDARLQLIVQSYQQLTGKALLNTSFSPDSMWDAPQAIVAHGTQNDPVFFYGNRRALELFGMSWAEFIRLPSRLSVEPEDCDARAVLMETVTRQGFVEGYSGMRISKNGTRFMISNATIWNLVDAEGVYYGQAATFC